MEDFFVDCDAAAVALQTAALAVVATGLAVCAFGLAYIARILKSWKAWTSGDDPP